MFLTFPPLFHLSFRQGAGLSHHILMAYTRPKISLQNISKIGGHEPFVYLASREHCSWSRDLLDFSAPMSPKLPTRCLVGAAHLHGMHPDQIVSSKYIANWQKQPLCFAASKVRPALIC